MVDVNEFLWVEKYRPKTVEDTILPTSRKKIFQKFVDDKTVPNLLLSGTAGTGKTTIAKAMLEEIGADYIVINGSMDGNIDTLRVEIKNFASTVSFAGGRKYVILDEADYLNPQSTQPALRNFMEEFSNNCGFILTCNFKNKVIEPLQSRCSVVDFTISKEETPLIQAKFFKRLCYILDTENIPYDKKILAEVVTRYYPDWRRTINEIQNYSANGKIDEGILAVKVGGTVTALIDFLRTKNFDGMRKWVGENSDMDSSILYRGLYDHLGDYIKSSSGVATAIIILGEYQYKEAFVADTEINRVACMSTLMVEVDWK